MGRLVAYLRILQKKFNRVLLKSKESRETPHSVQNNNNEEAIRLAPRVVVWLQTAWQDMRLFDTNRDTLLDLMQSSFRSGKPHKIYGLSGDEANDASKIMLKVS